MKALIVLGTIALATVLVVGGAWAGTAWAQDRWENDMTLAPALRSGANAGMGGNLDWDNMPCGEGSQGYGMGSHGMTSVPALCSGASAGMGPGMMGYGPGGDGMMGPDASGGDWDDMPCGDAYTAPGEGEFTSLEDVETAVHDYVERLGYTGLEVTEIMEFERNYYAIVAEGDTGIGALEVLVDKSSGAVGQEPGPNMMWNAKYGMHRGGMMGMRRPELGEGMGSYGYATGEMTVSSAEAEEIAQQWLDDSFPGRTAGEPDAFYGYYTLHFLKDGEIEGMLSVHGSTGDVWYHSWHGDFVTMIEGHE